MIINGHHKEFTELEPIGNRKRTQKELEELALQVFAWRCESNDFRNDFFDERYKELEYYDGDQLDEEALQTLADRDQPDVIFNRVAPGVDLISGTEQKSRTDTKYGGAGDEDSEKAGFATALSKHVTNANETNFLFSDAFKEAIQIGASFIRQIENWNPFEEELKEEKHDWDSVHFDPRAKQYDLQDGRFMMGERWATFNEAVALDPKMKSVLRDAVGAEFDSTEDTENSPLDSTYEFGGLHHTSRGSYWRDRDWMNRKTEMVLLAECEYYEYENAPYIANTQTQEVLEFDPENIGPETAQLIAMGVFKVNKGMIKRLRRCFFAGPYILSDEPAGYWHNLFSWTPIWAFRKKKYGHFYGTIYRMMDAQDIMNRTFGRMYYQTAVRQVFAEDGAVKDFDQFAVDVSDPAAVIRMEMGGIDKYRIENGAEQVRQNAQILSYAEQQLGENTGTNDEARGQQTNARSGTAINERQEQALATIWPLFDNIQRTKRILARKRLSLMQQLYDGPKRITITDQPGSAQYVTLNEDDGQGGVRNSIQGLSFDYVIDSQRESAGQRQAMAEQLTTQLNAFPPEMQMIVLKYILDLSDAPKKDEILAEMNQMQQTMAAQPPAASA